jgi:hypothetical protein
MEDKRMAHLLQAVMVDGEVVGQTEKIQVQKWVLKWRWKS